MKEKQNNITCDAKNRKKIVVKNNTVYRSSANINTQSTNKKSSLRSATKIISHDDMTTSNETSEVLTDVLRFSLNAAPLFKF